VVLGLLAQPDELAGQVLAELGVTVERARARVSEQRGCGPARPSGSLAVAPQTKRLLELSHAIAKSLGSRCAKTEHILLAATSPKLHSSAAVLLVDCGAPPEQVRDQLTRALPLEAPELAERLRNRWLLSRVRMRSI
jgi:ATP-dependent Clp protease ATP-binding subunit ClpA